MGEITITYYELMQQPTTEVFWPSQLPALDETSIQLASGDLSFDDDLVEPIEDWVEEQFISQYIVQLDLQAFAAAGQLEALMEALQYGSLIKHGDADFVSSLPAEELTQMVTRLMSMHLSNWDMDEELAKEESEISDLVGFLAQCKLRGHAILGVSG